MRLWPLPTLALALAAALTGPATAQEDTYVPESEPAVVAKLEQWQDLKLGLLMHWGPYSQWGIVESWSICPEDVEWIAHRRIEDYAEYKKAYEHLQTTFDPRGFDPERWAEAARDAGMKYVVFTTKHHDGFAMFDTRLSDYRITSPRTPFSTSPKADITRAIFDAFRSRGFMVGAYFSKPDRAHSALAEERNVILRGDFNIDRREENPLFVVETGRWVPEGIVIR
jgi:alpha-L-fucosidase